MYICFIACWYYQFGCLVIVVVLCISVISSCILLFIRSPLLHPHVIIRFEVLTFANQNCPYCSAKTQHCLMHGLPGIASSGIQYCSHKIDFLYQYSTSPYLELKDAKPFWVSLSYELFRVSNVGWAVRQCWVSHEAMLDQP